METKIIYKKLVDGVKEHLKKTGFSKVVIGISGGIDSAVVAIIAKEALGKENVLGLFMPGPFTSEQSKECAEEVAHNLGIELKEIPIDEIYSSYLKSLKEHFKGKNNDITEENLQARIRANILMAFSNKSGYFVLNTGNRSETAVGYCTLYGDMVGGLCVLSDIPKTIVYKLAEHINKDNEIIPRRIIERAPSAELSKGQTDQDILPPYDVLDEILHLAIDCKNSVDEIIRSGYDEKTVRSVFQLMKRNEFKKKQAPPGLKIDV